MHHVLDLRYMKKIAYVLLASTLLMGFASVAFADTTPLNFYCDPYQSNFAAGNYYMPTDGGACTYNLPDFGTSFIVVGIYKGVPGNAVSIKNDTGAYPGDYLNQNNFFGIDGLAQGDS